MAILFVALIDSFAPFSFSYNAETWTSEFELQPVEAGRAESRASLGGNEDDWVQAEDLHVVAPSQGANSQRGKANDPEKGKQPVDVATPMRCLTPVLFFHPLWISLKRCPSPRG